MAKFSSHSNMFLYIIFHTLVARTYSKKRSCILNRPSWINKRQIFVGVGFPNIHLIKYMYIFFLLMKNNRIIVITKLIISFVRHIYTLVYVLFWFPLHSFRIIPHTAMYVPTGNSGSLHSFSLIHNGGTVSLLFSNTSHYIRK